MSRYHLNRFLFDLKMKPATLDDNIYWTQK